jgi:hypothetical protein
MSASQHPQDSVAAAFDEMEQIEDIRECARLIAIGGMAARYNEIAELAYSDHNAAMKLFQETNKIPSSSMPELIWVKNAILSHICNVMVGKGRPAKPVVIEMDIQKHFFAHLDHYIEGATKAKPKMTKGHRPDGFISVDGLVAPVEVKLESFKSKSLEQLEWYMRVYGSKSGVAVAPELSCALPSNVRFIKITPAEVIAALR